MTNTRATDVEELEARSGGDGEWRRRVGSGGAGRHRGGDGVVSVATRAGGCHPARGAAMQRAPGLAGGVDGQPGLDTGRPDWRPVVDGVASGRVSGSGSPGWRHGWGRRVRADGVTMTRSAESMRHEASAGGAWSRPRVVTTSEPPGA